MEPHWFRRPTSGSPGRLNLCYGALDRRVVLGEADAVALVSAAGEWSLARTLTEVAALAGLLRGLGVGLGTRVRPTVTDPLTGALVEWATLRIGGVLTDTWPAHLGVADTESVTETTAVGSAAVWLLRGVPVLDERTQIGWDVGLAAGREEPAACVDVPGDAVAWTRDGASVESALALADDAPIGRRLATLTAGGVVDLRE